jgi:hypothetical protein
MQPFSTHTTTTAIQTPKTLITQKTQNVFPLFERERDNKRIQNPNNPKRQ